jgi:hypothetical protein
MNIETLGCDEFNNNHQLSYKKMMTETAFNDMMELALLLNPFAKEGLNSLPAKGWATRTGVHAEVVYYQEI